MKADFSKKKKKKNKLRLIKVIDHGKEKKQLIISPIALTKNQHTTNK